MTPTAAAHILIVEDDDAAARLQQKQLQRDGHEVTVAATLDAAREALSLRRFDLALFDYRLAADCNGVEAYQRLRAAHPRLQAILVSAFSNEELVVDAWRAGFRDFVPKSADYLAYLPAAVRQTLHRVLVEQALAESEELHRVTLGSVSDAVFITDDAGRFVYVCPSVRTAFGYDVDEAYRLGTIDGLLGESFRLDCQLDATGEASNIAHQAVDKFGQPRDLLVSVKRVSIRGGTLLYSCRDVTDRKRAEDELERQRTYSNYILGAAPFLFAVLGPDGTTEYVNPIAAQATGYAADELVGRSWWRQLYPDGESAQVELQLAAMGARPLSDCELPLTTRSGQKRVVSWNLTNVLDADGRTAKTIGIGADVTERKRLEDQLRQSQKMEAVGRLAGGIAHDFNNLLTIILGNTELALEGASPSAPPGPLLRDVLDAARRAASLTQQLLTFSRRSACEPQVVDVNHLVANVERLLARLIGEDIRISRQLADDLWPVRIDPVQLEQILFNLAVNARDAMPQGGELTIATENVQLDEADCRGRPDSLPGKYVLLSVRDTGVGMAPEVLERLFEPFFTTKPVGKGTGMGLATVFGIVKQCGGHISAASEPRRGATFRVYLPRWIESGAKDADAELTPPVRNGHETILLVEDEAPLRRLACSMLESHGYRVVEAPSSIEALAIAATHGEIDLLLTDVVMPDMGGRQLASRLALSRPRTKVIYMSGYSETAAACFGAGERPAAFLQKPFTREGLLRKVRAVLDGIGQDAAESSQLAEPVGG